MKDNATGSVRVTYYSSCVGDGPMRETSKCSGLRVGSRVQFTGNTFEKNDPSKAQKHYNSTKIQSHVLHLFFYSTPT